jgi:BirA family biotin operon repressor/biotin-[acetyl-CoA-carboxylase] ligase
MVWGDGELAGAQRAPLQVATAVTGGDCRGARCAPAIPPSYDGVDANELAIRLGVPTVVLYDTVPSTMDIAHTLAQDGTPAGTLVLADQQTSGRGQHGRSWLSAAGAGIWLTLIERPADTSGADILSLRVGLCIAEVLDPFAGARVRVKRPNDLYVAAGKVGGILTEARWHGERLAWVAVGVGVNTIVPVDVPGAAALPAHTSRIDVLTALVPALRAGVATRGVLTADELQALAAREVHA